MVQCSAVGCTSSSSDLKGTSERSKITFHRFPIDPIEKETWIRNIGREGWKPTKNDCLCSRHFEKKWLYKAQDTGFVKLLKTAIPTIFEKVELPRTASDKKSRSGGMICSVAVCKSRSKKKGMKDIRFFSFPKDPELCEEWVRRCYRVDPFSSVNKRICSIHFTSDDYADSVKAGFLGYKPRRLKKTAVPSLFLDRASQSLMESKIDKPKSPESFGIYNNEVIDQDDDVGTVFESDERMEIILQADDGLNKQDDAHIIEQILENATEDEDTVMTEQVRSLMKENQYLKAENQELKHINNCLNSQLAFLRKEMSEFTRES